MPLAHLLIISRLPAVAISGARRICTKMSLLLFIKLHPLIQMSIKNKVLFQTLEVAWLSSPPSSTNSTNCEFRLIAEPEYSSAEMAESPSKASLIEPLLAVYKRNRGFLWCFWLALRSNLSSILERRRVVWWYFSFEGTSLDGEWKPWGHQVSSKVCVRLDYHCFQKIPSLQYNMNYLRIFESCCGPVWMRTGTQSFWTTDG